MDACSIRYEVLTTEVYPLWSGFPASHCSSVREMTIASRFALRLDTSRISLIFHKQWHFDSPTSPPRLLKFRSGHQIPPHLIRYYGDDGKQLLTASRDRSLRYTSVVRDSRSFELSQGLPILSTRHSHSNPYPLRLFKQESIYIICATYFTQTLLRHSAVVLNYKIQGLGRYSNGTLRRDLCQNMEHAEQKIRQACAWSRGERQIKNYRDD